MCEKISLAVVTGQTASGKSTLALSMARELKKQGTLCEFLCCDSMQIYRGLDIGTEKPDAIVRAEFPHHGLDLVDPDEAFSAGDYIREAERVLKDMSDRNVFPIVVGGTGLYLRALTRGLVQIPEATTAAIAEKIKGYEQTSDAKALPEFYERMITIDPHTIGRIHPNDRYRIFRSLAIFEVAGKTWSDLQREHGFTDNPYRTAILALDWPRPLLYQRIEHRLDRMMERGLEKEIETLLGKGLSSEARSLQGLAYRWFVAAIQGKISREEALRLTKRDSRHFAKRQSTWFRSQKDIQWISGEMPLESQTQQALQIVSTLLQG